MEASTIALGMGFSLATRSAGRPSIRDRRVSSESSQRAAFGNQSRIRARVLQSYRLVPNLRPHLKRTINIYHVSGRACCNHIVWFPNLDHT